MRALALGLLGVLLASPAGRARAHDFSPGVLSIVEEAPGVYRYTFSPPVDDGVDLPTRVDFPSSCEVEAHRLRCPGGLRGEVRFGRGIDRRTQIVVLLETRDGRRTEAVVGGATPTWTAEASRDGIGTWIAIGAEHVALGLDHVAFVLGLLLVLVAGDDRAHPRRLLARVAAAISAFTLGHSLTLALATLHVVRLPSPPVEATIALSVVLLAVEASHGRPTLTRRRPWLVALGFGLVHGLGFASALEGIGLPSGSVATALVGFNVGVELAQLAVVLFALGVGWTLRSRRHAPRLRTLAVYALGCAGAYWCIARCVALGA